MMAIPKPMLETLGLAADATVALRLEDGRLIVEPRRRPRYTLAELLGQHDPEAHASSEAVEWQAAEAVGREVL